MSFRMSPATVAAVVVSLGLGYVAGALPTNSVGSPQIKNGQVKSADLQNDGVTSTDIKDGTVTGYDIKDGWINAADLQDGGVTPVDLAPGTVPEVRLIGTRNDFSGCDQGCYLPGSPGVVVADLSTAPPNALYWTSSGPWVLLKPGKLVVTATVDLHFTLDLPVTVRCNLDDIPGRLVTGQSIRTDAWQENQTVTITTYAELAPGNHSLRVTCQGSPDESVVVRRVAITGTVVSQ